MLKLLEEEPSLIEVIALSFIIMISSWVNIIMSSLLPFIGSRYRL